MEREPYIKGGQDRNDDEVEQCGLVVGIMFVAVLALAVGLLLGWLAAGGMG